MAQDAPQADVTIGALELKPAIEGDAPLLTDEYNAVIDQTLAVDPNSFAEMPVRQLRLPALTMPKGLDLSRTDRADGSGTVIVRKPLATEWDANIGADLGLASNQPGGYSKDNPLGVVRNDRGSGAAWASVGVPNFASVDARVDPSNDQGRLATTFKHALPVGDGFAVSVHSRYSVTETLSQPQAADTRPRVWGNENFAKFDILSTGTTLGAGISTTSADPVTHNTLSAEQKIYGPLGLATTVTDIGRPGESKSLSARMKLTW
ncbi:MAG: hypothetical protein Q7T81_01400 [Pseudolabrys sp.]|nr:hypothetical protein [Pseudolabrys sp.]